MSSPLTDKVCEFRNLEKGWDSYEALPPSETAIQNTLTFLGILENLSLAPDWVEPTSDDSIMLEVKVGEVLQEWDFYSDGIVAVLYEKDGEAVECKLVKPEVGAMSRHVTFEAGNRGR
jgi:hypothetical protein